MKIKFAFSKIAQGVFNADTAMEYLQSKDLFITEELYNDLKAAEQAYNDAKTWPKQDTIVGVKGFNDNPDFTANFRGRITNERWVVVMCHNGMQLEVAGCDVYPIPSVTIENHGNKWSFDNMTFEQGIQKASYLSGYLGLIGRIYIFCSDGRADWILA